MTWLAAVGAGAGLGLVHFGGLWLMVRGAVSRSMRPRIVSHLIALRLALLGYCLTFLVRGGAGAGAIVAMLVGIWLARWVLIRRITGGLDGR